MKTKVSRIVLVCTSLVILIGIAGCEIVDSQTIKDVSSDVQLLSSRVDDYQEEMTKMVGMLETDGIVDSKVMEKLDRINEEIDRVQPQISEIAVAIEGKELWDAAGAANAASAPWNPYAIPIAAALALAEAMTVVLLKKKSNEANDNAAMYVEEYKKKNSDKVGREKTLRELATMDEKDITASMVKSMMYKNIGDERRGNGVV